MSNQLLCTLFKIRDFSEWVWEEVLKEEEMKRWLGLPILLLSIVFLAMNCGGGGGDSPPPGQSSQPPIATTNAATSVDLTMATLNATVNPNGMATTVYFMWGTSSSLAGAAKTPDQAIGAGVANVSVAAPLSGLVMATTYYYQVVATTAAGTSKGAIMPCTTGSPGAAPTVQTVPPTSITSTSATLNGSVNPNGLTTTAYFEWGTDITFLGAGRTPDQAIGAGSASLAINAPITGLAFATTYYFRVVATNSAGTSRGSAISFVHFPRPTTQTLNATLISANSATLNAGVNPNGRATTVYFLWGTDPNLVGASRTSDQAIGAGVTNVSVNAPLTSLMAITTYYFKVVATSGSGTNDNAVIVSFTTLPLAGAPPTVQTMTATPIAVTSATLQGNIETKGLATTAYFLWGTSTTLAGASRTSDQVIGASTVSMVINAPLSGLTASTTYYFQVVAINSAGTDNGAIVSFTTLASTGNLPEAFAYYAHSVTENSMILEGGARSSNLPATAYFEYSTDPSFVGALRTPDQAVTPGLFGTNFSATITDLSPSTYYYYRVVATNAAGTSYSGTTYLNPPVGINVMSTLPAAGWPVAITRTDEAVGSITSNSIRVNGFFTSTSLPATVYFEYGASVNFAVALKTPDQIINPTNSENVIAAITGLSPATDYYYRAVATNTNGTSIGMIITFRTLP